MEEIHPNIIKALLDPENTISVNKTLIQKLGAVTALVLGFYIHEHRKQGSPEWFTCTHETISKGLCMTKHTIREEKKTLLSLKILTRKIEGMPAKEMFKINLKVMLDKLHETDTETQGIGETLQTSRLQTPSHLQQKIIYKHNISNNSSLFGESEEQNNKSKKSRRRRRTFALRISQFEDFWQIYPNKSSKGRARAAWEKLCKKDDAPTFSELKRAIRQQEKSERWQTSRMIPYPSTWLNNYGWLDDVSTLTVPKNGNHNGEARYKGEKIEYKTAEKV